MGVVFLEKKEDYLVGIWHITEDKETLQEALPPEDVYASATKHPTKILERLAARVLVKKIVKEMGFDYASLSKTCSQKPFLPHLDCHLSISHCYPYASVIVHRSKSVGIDIQKPVDKISRVFPRVMNQEEINQAKDLPTQTLFWSAKEALYKLADFKGVFFKEEIQVQFQGDSLKGKIRNSAWHQLSYFDFDGMKIVYCIETESVC